MSRICLSAPRYGSRGRSPTRKAKGDILADGKSIVNTKVNDRAKLGIFLQFQNPVEVEGLGLMNFLNAARGSIHSDMQFKDFMSEVKNSTKKLSIKEELVGRSLNFGFSGGEKKKIEMLQMAVLKPKLAILDEPDSGLDIDAVKTVAENINELRQKNKMGILLITHYSRILNYMEPQFIHIMKDGVIKKDGGKDLINEVETKGYKL